MAIFSFRPGVSGTLLGPIEAGSDDDFSYRFLFQNLSIGKFIVPDDKRKAFDRDYNAMYQNLLEARYAKQWCLRHIKEHKEAIETGRDGKVINGSQINITNPINTELNIFFKDFFIRTEMATQCLMRLFQQNLDCKLSFLFSDEEKKFNKGAADFKLKSDDPRFKTLVDFISSHRAGWYEKFKNLRDEIEHQGFKLPDITYQLDSAGKVVVDLPKLEGSSIEEVLTVGWQNLSNLCEEIYVFILSLELEPPFIIWRIPEEKRAAHNWARYKVAMPEFPEATVS